MGFLLKGVLLYLLLSIAIALAVPNIVFENGSPTDATVLGWFNKSIKLDSNNNIYQVPEAYSLDGDVQDTISNLSMVPQLPTGTGFLGFIDPLLHTFGFIGTIAKVFASPIIVMSKPEMTGIPIGFILIIIIPLVALFIIGLIGWIRSGEM
jgi:hypothetical protein